MYAFDSRYASGTAPTEALNRAACTAGQEVEFFLYHMSAVALHPRYIDVRGTVVMTSMPSSQAVTSDKVYLTRIQRLVVDQSRRVAVY